MQNINYRIKITIIFIHIFLFDYLSYPIFHTIQRQRCFG